MSGNRTGSGSRRPGSAGRSGAGTVAIFVFLALTIGSQPAAWAEGQTVDGADGREGQSGRITVVEENDYFTASGDKHYTQGARLSWLSPSLEAQSGWNAPFDTLKPLALFGGADRARRYEWIVAGQSIFTPRNTQLPEPQPRDRPYAAWLYTGFSLLQETRADTHDTLENLELLGGVVGPAALGGITQNDFHQFIGVNSALGWKNQLRNEPGFILSYERKWRFQHPLAAGLGVDAIPEFGVSGGNVLTYAETGVLVRLGRNLAADYGPARVRPGLSGTGWFAPERLDGDLGWAVFAGVQGRAVGHNIFLDGNTFSAGPAVPRKVLVGDVTVGASLFWSDAVRLDLAAIQRSKEFYGQRGNPDRFGGINVSFRF